MQMSRELKAQIIVTSSDSDAADLQQRWLEAADEYPSLRPPAVRSLPKLRTDPTKPPPPPTTPTSYEQQSLGRRA
jgi:hypothetical protein